MKTHVAIVVDRSYPTNNGTVHETFNAVNNFVASLKDNNDILSVTIHQFDDKFDTLCLQESHSEVPELSVDDTFIPGTVTPLFDAIGNSIALMGAKKNVFMCVIANNYDNASSEFDLGPISTMVDEKTKVGWNFNFMSSKPELVVDGTNMGFNVGINPSERSFAPTKRGFARLTKMCVDGLEEYMMGSSSTAVEDFNLFEVTMDEYDVVSDIVDSIKDVKD